MKDLLFRMVNMSTHLKVVDKGQKMLNYTIFKVADKLEALHNTGELESIKSIGAYVNISFTNAFNDFQKSFLSIEDRIDIIHEYQKLW
ncbi:hypothetical protein P4T89_09435 [Bacillus nakamurai]|uniref:Uncharacterized protein n=1 Tax=Bacillus nakamurai TaxID=1793963 RepID=A0A150F345_9BACI|nr:hypothetical protein [Bacillus nakamurai]KXZ13169.1 hypothetical protein AXI58_05705 [Bacillus nakamurai]MED1227802.1 hypothetical protein [Bacillus nakamurai]